MKWLITGLFWVPAISWACVHSVEITDTYAEVCASSDSCRVLDYVDLPNGGASKKVDAAIEYFQAFLDVRIPLAILDPEDPDKAVDPNCENFYWGLEDGRSANPVQATHLIARNCVIEDVTWDGTMFQYTLRRADRCQ